VFAVILAPTRELAYQIHQVVEQLGLAMGAKSVCIVGGVDMATQSIALARNPHVIVATPGRLVDHLTHTKGFHLRQVKYLVMDEADRMLSLDFEQELNQILDVIPDSSTGRRTMLFSATMTSKVEKLQRASLHNPVRVEVSTKFQTPKKLLQSYLFIPAKYKDCYLTYLINEHAGQSILVFGATCNNVQRLALMLRNLGFPAVCLHGQMSQPKRLGALNKFKSGDREILVCTDVASRGLDIPSVDVVINFDLPGHGKDYIHRVGRTARAGRSGKAIAMVTQYDVEVYQRLEGLLGKKLPEYKLDEETVLVLLERVSEAQRMATRELKEQLAAAKGNNRRKRKSSDDAGDEDDMEKLVEKELKKGYYVGGSGGRGGALPNQRGALNKKKHKNYRR
jgi:ATP-dependent RNA helicase DDX47/RRP3